MAAELKARGNQLYGQGKVEEAIALYKSAIEALLSATPAAATAAAGADAKGDAPIAPAHMLVNGGKDYSLNRRTVTSTVATTSSGPASTSPPNAENSNKDGSSSASAAADTQQQVNKDVAILFSNASQGLLDLKRFEAAAASAEAAVSYDPLLLKAWVRRVRALVGAGSKFEAFILYYSHVVPLTKKGTRTEQQEALKFVMDLGEQVADGVGVSGIHASLALRMTSHAAPKKADGTSTGADTTSTAPPPPPAEFDGGLSTVATANINVDAVIFTEKQFIHPKLDPKVPDAAQDTLTTELLIQHFSNQLVAAIRSPSVKEAQTLWTTFASVMRGSWPRNLREIGAELSTRFVNELRTHHKKDIEEGYIIDNAGGDGNGADAIKNNKFSVTLEELTHLAVACRYNCFHSGFFRTCALANHSCNPNAAMKYVAAQNKVVLVAVRDIKAGEDITVKYLPDLEYILGVSRRREILYRSWLFWCDCGRCDKDLFDKEGSKHEWIKCKACNDPVNGYAHLPTQGIDEGVTVADPSIPSSSACFGCGATVTISKAESVALIKTVDSFLKTIQSAGHMTMLGMSDLLLSVWKDADVSVHSEHWTHRAQLYCYCLVLGDTIRSTFSYAVSPQGAPEEAKGLLYSFGLAPLCGSASAAEAAKGGDMLVALLELWRRIEAFYPPAQAYHLHLMITQLLAMNMLLPEDQLQLDYEVCAAILANHTPFIGPQERGAQSRAVLQVKDRDKGIKWSPKALKAVKKAYA